MKYFYKIGQYVLASTGEAKSRACNASGELIAVSFPDSADVEVISEGDSWDAEENSL